MTNKSIKRKLESIYIKYYIKLYYKRDSLFKYYFIVTDRHTFHEWVYFKNFTDKKQVYETLDEVINYYIKSKRRQGNIEFYKRGLK